MAVVSDDEHAVTPGAVGMVIKNGPRVLIVYGDNLVPALEMLFNSKTLRDDFYTRLVAAMGA